MLRVGQEELVVVGRVSHAASTSWPAVYGREAIWTWATLSRATFALDTTSAAPSADSPAALIESV